MAHGKKKPVKRPQKVGDTYKGEKVRMSAPAQLKGTGVKRGGRRKG